jgi:hypothetical protein
MGNLKPGMFEEVEFFHRNKKLVIKILPGGYNRNRNLVEKMYGWKVAKSFGEAWDKIFGPKPQKPPVIHVDKGVPGGDKTVKATFQKTEKGIILESIETVSPGTETPVTIGENRGKISPVH